MSKKPIISSIPSGYKSNKVYSVLPSNGDADFPFSRTTQATRVNKDGFIETVEANIPRLDYSDNGCPSYLIEPASTNLLPNSEIYNTWNKAALSNSAVNEVNPKGLAVSQKITQTGSGGFLWYPRTFTGNETFSAFVKKDTSNFARLYAAGNSVFFDIVNGTIESEIGSDITDKSIIDYGNGWFRISISVNSTASNVRVYPASSSTSSSGINSMFVWGTQLEQKSYTTSYIPTNSNPESRGVDNVVNFFPDYWQELGGIPYYSAVPSETYNLYNNTEGVLFFEMKPSALDFTKKIITLSSGHSDDKIVLGYSTNNNLIASVISGGFYRAVLGTGIQNAQDFNKIAFKYKPNDFSLFVNGTKISSENSGLTFPDNTLKILRFSGVGGDRRFYGSIKQFMYFNTDLTDTELINLTT